MGASKIQIAIKSLISEFGTAVLAGSVQVQAAHNGCKDFQD